MHIIDFFWIIRFNPDSLSIVEESEMHNTYKLVSNLFKTNVIYDIIYVIGAILLGFHLSHGFWSAFQTLGLNNKQWLKRWQVIGYVYAVIITIGFSVIPLYFLIKF
jgi:succinate dehydrogenase / fumarate reductase cytochrome b subunit